MTTLHELPSLLIAAIALLLGTGLITLTWGRKLPRQGDWVVSAGLLGLFATFAVKAGEHLNHGFKARAMLRGWVGPTGEPGSIAVGILEDPLGFAMSAVAIAIVAVTLSNRHLILKEPRPERTYAALAFSTAGVALSWISLTPWLGLIGLALTVFGGFVALGARWDEDDEAALATSFIAQRSWGILLAVLGACGLALSRMGLGWGDADGWSATEASSLVDALGGGFLLAGIFVQFQPFPFLGWVATPSRTPTLFRVLPAQILPGLAAFAILIRSSGELDRMGMLVPFGWIQLGSAALALGTGLAQTQWRMGLGAWLSAAFSISSAALAFSGPASSFSLLIGAGLGGAAIAYAASCLSAGGATQSASNRSRALWSRIVGLCGMALATGLLLFPPAGGVIQWIVKSWNEPLLAAVFVLAFFAYCVLGWRLAWQLFLARNLVQISWVSVLSPLLLILLGLAVVWSGTFTGGALPGDPDRVMSSALEVFFNGGATAGLATDDATFMAASGTFWATLLVAMALAYWLSQDSKASSPKEKAKDKEKAREKTKQRAASPLVAFMAEGYGADRAGARVLASISFLGARVVQVVDVDIWRQWVPSVLATALGRLAAGAMAIDTRISRSLRATLRQAVDLPARGLQLLQNGDVQWYLFFAIGSGVVMLIHFMRN